jgi:hypothetical protein
MCQAVYPDLKLEPQTPHVWEDLLRDIEPESILAAIRGILKSWKRASLPPVALVRERALEHQRRRQQLYADLRAAISYLEHLPDRTNDEERELELCKHQLAHLEPKELILEGGELCAKQ